MSYTFSVCASCEAVNRVDSEKAIKQTPTCGKCGNKLPIHSLVSEVSANGLRKLLAKADKPVIADFWASWCGPCKAYAPKFSAAALNLRDAVFVKLNTEVFPALSNDLGIRGVPTTVVFKNGREYRRQSGVIPENAIPQLLK